MTKTISGLAFLPVFPATFYLTVAVGAWVNTVPELQYFHSARRGLEPNLAGMILVWGAMFTPFLLYLGLLTFLGLGTQQVTLPRGRIVRC
ncbi:MAG: hypothetical protein AAF714_05185 [Pseudomonadota bacterium]